MAEHSDGHGWKTRASCYPGWNSFCVLVKPRLIRVLRNLRICALADWGLLGFGHEIGPEVLCVEIVGLSGKEIAKLWFSGTQLWKETVVWG